MRNCEFKIGSHILVQGGKGIVENIEHCNIYTIKYGNKIVSDGVALSEDTAQATIKNGYIVEPTGKTQTYFKVSFDNDSDLKNTSYNHGIYGCIDDYECYGTW